MEIVDIVFKVVGTLISLILFMLGLRSYRLWKESKAEWLLLVMAGLFLVAVITGFIALRLWALMFYLVLASIVSWYFDRHSKGRATRLSMLVSSILLLFVSSFIIIATVLDCDSQQLRDKLRRDELRYHAAQGVGLGAYLESQFPDARILLVTPPLNEVRRETVENLDRTLTSAFIVAKEPASLEPPDDPDAQRDANQPPPTYDEFLGTMPITVERLHDLVEQYPECDVIVLFVALPEDFADSRFVPMPEQVEAAKNARTREGSDDERLIEYVRTTTSAQKKVWVAPPLVVVDNRVMPHSDSYLSLGILHTQVINNITAIYDPERIIPEDDTALFNERWVIVNAGNLGSIDERYRARFTREP